MKHSVLQIALLTLVTAALQAGAPTDQNPEPTAVAISPTISPWETTLTIYGWRPSLATATSHLIIQAAATWSLTCK